jgi:hypothetical protein
VGYEVRLGVDTLSPLITAKATEPWTSERCSDEAQFTLRCRTSGMTVLNKG